MKRNAPISFACLVLVMLLHMSCTDTSLYQVRGTLYTDSTLTTPLSGQELVFAINHGDTLGSVLTDSQGRFGFAYNIGVDPLVDDRKFHFEYSWLFILYNGDTLYGKEYPSYTKDTLILYPGCWKGGFRW